MKRIIYIASLVLLISACSKKGGSGPVPGKAGLVAPLKDLICNNGTVVSATESSVAFSWNAATNATGYDLTIKNLLTQTEAVQATTSTNATVTLKRNTPYSWFVTSKSSKNTTVTTSDVWKFYNAGAGVTNYAPYPADLLTPGFGDIISPANGKINITWKGAAVNNNIVGYIVYFGPSSNPAIFRERTTDSFVNDITVSANTTYYWHVVTIDANSNISDSGINNFYVK